MKFDFMVITLPFCHQESLAFESEFTDVTSCAELELATPTITWA
jgi:hypothetical protein